MSANQWTDNREWGNEPTTILPAYRVLQQSNCGPLIHVTPTGYHTVEYDCDGQCLTCMQPLEAQQ